MRKGAACIKSLRNVSILLHTVPQSLQLLPASGPAPRGHNVRGCLQLDSCPVPSFLGHTSLSFQLSRYVFWKLS